MAVVFIPVFLTFLIASPASTPRETKSPTPQAKQESIESRIQNLQSTRDCIDKAQSHQAAASCRANLKQKSTSSDDPKK